MTGPFFYDLPAARIAQRPVHPPESARMLVVDRAKDSIQDSTFASIGTFLRRGDCLVFNNTKVLPARLFGTLPHGGEVELLLLKRIADGLWECMGRPLKKLRAGTSVTMTDDLSAHIQERIGEKMILVKFESTDNAASVDRKLLAHGCMPIPPYIRGGRSDDEDRLDYQSIFARHDGSVAAPTASLHFSEHLIAALLGQGIELCEVTLHVGSSSFLAVWDPAAPDTVQKPGIEYYQYDEAVLQKLEALRKGGGRVFAVGTTVARALESMARCEASGSGSLVPTELFITPGYRVVSFDGLVTNFHQPGTTHLLLVEALIGAPTLERVYAHALSSGYRFLSYGDGMIILP